jgi:hypothetical protein
MKNNTIRNYRNTVQIRFKDRDGMHCLSLKKLPDYGNWITIIRFLKSRGWTIKENSHYKEQYSCLSPFHKIGFKGNLALLMEISGTSISIEFGHIKNLWEHPQSFWDIPSDDRYTKLTYLENAAVKLEVKKMMEFGAFKFRLKDTSENPNPSPEEYIINKCNTNTHIHGKVSCLNDIKLDIIESSYDYQVNSNDKNGKKIICGETAVALIQIVGVFLFGFVMGVPLTLVAILRLLPAAIVVCLFGAAFGVFVLSNIKSQRTANQIFPFVIFPQFLLAGVFGPIKQLPPVLYILSRIAPMTYAVDITRAVYYTGRIEYQKAVLYSLVTDVVIVTIMFLIFFVAGTFLFVRNEQNR